MKVSIVISTRNAAENLAECLKSIERQGFSDIEIVVTDNYSQDGTVQIAGRYGAKVFVSGPPPPYNNFFTGPIQKRIGGMLATGDCIFYVDADMILQDGLIEECVKLCEEGAGAVAVPEVSFGIGFWSQCKVAERKCYFQIETDDWSIQACRFFTLSTFESIGGWDSGGVGCLDDWEMTARLLRKGCVIRRSRRRLFHNEGNITLRRLTIKKRMMGKAAYLVKYLSSEVKSPGLLYQVTPLRLILLVKRLPGVTRNISFIFGAVFMKVIEGVAFLIGVLSSSRAPNQATGDYWSISKAVAASFAAQEGKTKRDSR